MPDGCPNMYKISPGNITTVSGTYEFSALGGQIAVMGNRCSSAELELLFRSIIWQILQRVAQES